MTDIQFDEEQQYRQHGQAEKAEKKSLFIRLVLATGVVSTDRQAEYVLLGIAVVGIIVSLFLSFGGGSHTPQKPPAAMLEQMKQIPINQ